MQLLLDFSASENKRNNFFKNYIRLLRSIKWSVSCINLASSIHKDDDLLCLGLFTAKNLVVSGINDLYVPLILASEKENTPLPIGILTLPASKYGKDQELISSEKIYELLKPSCDKLRLIHKDFDYSPSAFKQGVGKIYKASEIIRDLEYQI